MGVRLGSTVSGLTRTRLIFLSEGVDRRFLMFVRVEHLELKRFHHLQFWFMDGCNRERVRDAGSCESRVNVGVAMFNRSVMEGIVVTVVAKVLG